MSRKETSKSTVENTAASEALAEKINALTRTATELKSRFIAGALPLDTDFEALIDAIYVALTAVGLATDPAAPGDGLIITNDKLSVKGTGAVTVNSSGVGVKVASYGRVDPNTSPAGVIHNDENGLYIRTGTGNTKKGLAQFGTGNGGILGIALSDDPGLKFDAEGRLEAVVKSEPEPLKAGDGIGIKDGVISVKSGNGITTGAAGVAIKLAGSSPGLIFDDVGGLKSAVSAQGYSAGSGINISNINQVSIKLAQNSGLAVDSSGLKLSEQQQALTAGNGISIDNGKVSLVLANSNSGLKVDYTGLALHLTPSYGIGFEDDNGALKISIKIGSGLKFNEDGALAIANAMNSGLILEDGLKINADNLLAINENELTISSGRYVVPGMIQQFMGDPATVPEGWAICDGSVNKKSNVKRPDLREKFILANRNNSDGEGMLITQDVIYIINEGR
ncbi:hypothetical protein [Enterobacter bugandensis]|uniref:hypothetical protein n=1 Tax=Enterobacter bugandensis TaxID=881260 RepID=UPI002FCEB300